MNPPRDRSSNVLISRCGLIVFLMFLLTVTAAPLDAQLRSTRSQQRSGSQIKLSRDAQRLINQALNKQQNRNLKGFLRDLQQAREKYGDWLIRSARQDGLFIGVDRKVHRILFSLGEEERRVYRDLYEEQARQMLRDAGDDPDRSRLWAVYETYPLTKSAVRALERVADRHLKQGRFEDALSPLRTLMKVVAAPPQRASAAARILFCLSHLGTLNDQKSFRTNLPESLLDQTLSWRNEKRTLREISSLLTEEAGLPPPIDSSGNQPDAGNWIAPGGSTRHTKYQGPDVRFDELTLRMSFPVPAPALGRYREVGQQFSRNSRKHLMTSGLFPIIADRKLFLSNGRTAWSWPFPPDSTDRSPAQPARRELLDDASFDGDDVLFDNRLLFPGTYGEGLYVTPLVTTIGRSEQQMLRLQVTYPIPWRSLYAFDADTGDIKWHRGGKNREESVFHGMSFPSGAMYRDGTLYATVTQFNTTKDTPDLFAVAIDADKGTLLWKTFLTKNMLSSNLFENSIREVIPSVVAVDERRVYLSTNVGQVAALNRDTGRFSWLYRYLQRPFPPNQSLQPIRQRLLWRNNVPLRMKNTLLVTPPDATHLLAFDPSSGRLKWKHHYNRLRKKLKSFPRWMVPVRSRGYLLAGSTTAGVFSSETGTMLAGSHTPPHEIKGRPAVTSHHIYLPLKNGIEKIRYRFLDGGRSISLESVATWDPGNQYEPGNLFLSSGTLICISSNRMLVYEEQRE